MARLNKQEISAIAFDIYDKINAKAIIYNSQPTQEEFNKWVKEFKKTDEYTILKACYDIIIDVNKTLIRYKYTQYGSKYNIEAKINKPIEDILRTIYDDLNPPLPYKGDILQIERDIIIAQARSESLDVVIQQLIEKYS